MTTAKGRKVSVQALVFAPDHDGHAAHFVMRLEDARVGTPQYRVVSLGLRVSRREFVTDGGERWDVASDWSAAPQDQQPAPPDPCGLTPCGCWDGTRGAACTSRGARA